jgi:hypothetical protein
MQIGPINFINSWLFPIHFFRSQGSILMFKSSRDGSDSAYDFAHYPFITLIFNNL